MTLLLIENADNEQQAHEHEMTCVHPHTTSVQANQRVGTRLCMDLGWGWGLPGYAGKPFTLALSHKKGLQAKTFTIFCHTVFCPNL